jgi:hypothetical protein
MSSAGLFPLHKEVLNLVEIFETVKFPRAIGRFINQQAAVVSGPHVSGWRSSQTTANALCFVAQLTLSDLIGGCHSETRVWNSRLRVRLACFPLSSLLTMEAHEVRVPVLA